MVERTTWWVLPGMMHNSNDMSGYLCDMSPGWCFALEAEKKMINGWTLIDDLLSGQKND